MVYSLLYYLPLADRKNRLIRAFPKGMNAKWKANSFIQDLNSDRPFHFNDKRCTKHATNYEEDLWFHSFSEPDY